MNKIDIEIAKRERLHPMITYSYHIEPLTEQANIAFAHYGNERGGIKNLWNIVKDNPALKKSPFIGKYVLYYADPHETEERREVLVSEHATWYMAECFVPGITHMKSDRRTFYISLEKDVDYRVVIGKKIVHEQPTKLTFDDIKEL